MSLSPTSSRGSTVTFSGARFTRALTALASGGVITFDAVTFDTDNYANGSATPGVFVIPATGKYLVECEAHMNTGANSLGVNCQLSVNGGGAWTATLASPTLPGGGAFQQTLGLAFEYAFNAADQIRFVMFTDGAGNSIDARAAVARLH